MRRILLIEDDRVTQDLLTYLLRAFGYAVEVAGDGVAGVSAAIADPPDLIICDMQLPKLDGFGIVQRLKDSEVTSTIPIIAVTALAMSGDREQMIAAGFDGYIAKPVDPETFVGQIEPFLSAEA